MSKPLHRFFGNVAACTTATSGVAGSAEQSSMDRIENLIWASREQRPTGFEDEDEDEDEDEPPLPKPVYTPKTL